MADKKVILYRIKFVVSIGESVETKLETLPLECKETSQCYTYELEDRQKYESQTRRIRKDQLETNLSKITMLHSSFYYTGYCKEDSLEDYRERIIKYVQEVVASNLAQATKLQEKLDNFLKQYYDNRD